MVMATPWTMRLGTRETVARQMAEVPPMKEKMLLMLHGFTLTYSSESTTGYPFIGAPGRYSVRLSRAFEY
jgi:hypothetical protein